MNIFCIDIGGTNIKYAMFENGIMSNIGTTNTPKGLYILDMKKSLFSLVDTAIHNYGVVDFISISTCGQMFENEVVYTSSKPGYIGCNWANIFSEEYNIPCVANNDLHCAVMGEYYHGFGCDNDKPSNFICLAIGTGINIGTIINGELFTGDGNLSCYLDNLTDLDGKNQFKCASTASLLKLYEEKSGTHIGGKEFILLLEDGDTIATECYSLWINRVANILKAVLYMYNINNITICGGIINSSYPILKDIQKALTTVAAKPYYENLCLNKSLLSSSQLYGAYAFAEKSLSIIG